MTGVGSLYFRRVVWSTFHHSPGGLVSLPDLLGSGGGESEEGGGALVRLLGTLTGKGEEEEEEEGAGEGEGSFAGGSRGAGDGDGEGEEYVDAWVIHKEFDPIN